MLLNTLFPLFLLLVEAANDSVENWQEITDAEAEEVRARLEVEAQAEIETAAMVHE